jgi:hypothetical protein
MRPREPPASTTDDLFRARLLNIINPRHELVRLSGLIDWRRFDEAFRALYAEIGARYREPTPSSLGHGPGGRRGKGNSRQALCGRPIRHPPRDRDSPEASR